MSVKCVFSRGCIRIAPCTDRCRGRSVLANNNNFPRELYVIIDADSSTESPLFLASSNPGEFGLPNNVTPTARYVLAGHGETVNETKYTETHEEE